MKNWTKHFTCISMYRKSCVPMQKKVVLQCKVQERTDLQPKVTIAFLKMRQHMDDYCFLLPKKSSHLPKMDGVLNTPTNTCENI